MLAISCSIRTPARPPPFPSLFSPRRAPRPAKFLAGATHLRRRPLPFPATQARVRLQGPPPHLHLLVQSHLLDPFYLRFRQRGKWPTKFTGARRSNRNTPLQRPTHDDACDRDPLPRRRAPAGSHLLARPSLQRFPTKLRCRPAIVRRARATGDLLCTW